ncbi:MAG TPA: hypothetical protein VEU30_10535, partial [Thermoanaerobaculia bacterium]|nr:hypothetical protein [Thermoanaerobaculia bacterium]
MDALKEASAFFRHEGPVYDALARVAQRLADCGIDYAVIGGMAMAAHGYMRYTADVDILVATESVGAVEQCFADAGYTRIAKKKWRDEAANTPIDVFVGSEPA